MREKLPKVEEKKIEDLLIILERHFDPDKKPKSNSNSNVSNNKALSDKRSVKPVKNLKINDDKENNNKCDSGTDTADTTTPTTTTSDSSVKLTTSQDVEIKTVGYV